jgi:predicted nucleotidyltransferase
MREPLKEIIKRILEEAHPDKIILFGSRAKDRARKSSDYDICVLVKRGVNLKDLEKRLYLKLFGTGVAVDIIAEFVDRFEEAKNNRYLIYHEIAKDAVVIYG